MVASVMAMEHQIKGWVGQTSMASAGGVCALGESFRLIRDGYMDRMIVGGLDLNVNRNVVEGMDLFSALSKNRNE